MNFSTVENSGLYNPNQYKLRAMIISRLQPKIPLTLSDVLNVFFVTQNPVVSNVLEPFTDCNLYHTIESFSNERAPVFLQL